TNCNGQCVNTQTDTANCGGCAKPCPGGQVCSGGVCGMGCPQPLVVCNGGCADPRFDPNNCNGCGQVCPGAAHAIAVCATSTCNLVCSAGYVDCDRSGGNGCEININTDANNCGGCAKVCAGAANASPSCAAGVCGITCSNGFANCDNNNGNGCEI